MNAVNTRLEVQVDTAVAELWMEIYKMRGYVSMARKSLEYRHVAKNETRIAEINAEIENYKTRIATIQEQVKVVESPYRANPWSRFFLVQGGHIHRSTSCSTCYPTTQFAWLPELSGLTEKDAVAAYGTRLCSVCFPTAPVEWTVGIAKPEGCAGSGTYGAGRNGAKPTAYDRYRVCETCGDYVAVTSSNKLRKHKAK